MMSTSTSALPDIFIRRARRRILLVVILVFLIVIASVISISIGQYQLPLERIWSLLVQGPMATTDLDASVLWQIRLPRLVLGLFVGAALGVGGALMQAVFSNPLAEPSVIGVSSGAGVGAALIIVFGASSGIVSGSLVTWATPVGAFVAGLLTTALVYQLSRMGGQSRVVTLILVGIAVNAVAGAAISMLVYMAPTTAREQIIFWQMGTLAGANWEQTGVVAVLVTAGVVVSIVLGKGLDVLALGDSAAGHVGLNVQRVRMFAIVVSTLLTAGAISFSGLIGFVGLVVPHIVRTIVGPSNRVLIPMSALGGALLIGVADIFSRTLIPFADLPIGIFTALIGGPTFFFLLRNMIRKRQRA